MKELGMKNLFFTLTRASMQSKALVLVLLASTSLSTLSFQASHQSGIVTACINKSTGVLRIAKSCSHIESEFNWDVKGAQGAIGLTGATGATGAEGARGLTGATGPKGATGAAGANGRDGLRGIQIWYGTTDPVQTIGLSGDFYVNTQTNVWFGPKVETWPVGVSIVGPAGATGPAGPTGAAGPSGAPGEAGAVGATGPAGPGGPAGPAGTSAIAITQLSVCGVSGNSLCQIGSQGPGGGIIFFVDYQNLYPSFNYLEAAPLACEAQRQWSSDTTNPLGSVSTWASRAVGSGLANTNAMVAAGDISGAAEFAHTLACGGKSDWFLPSIGESNLMLSTLEGMGLFHSDGSYWSSNELDATNAFTFNLNLANLGTSAKSASLYVGPIREF